MKYDPFPKARVRGPLPPMGMHDPAAGPNGLVMPLYALYTPGQVALATFLGTPIAGAWLLARNFKKLGLQLGWVMLVLGFFWTAGLCVLGAAEKLPGIVSILSIPGMVLVMRAVQGTELDRHTSLGGRRASWGWAVGTGLIFLAGLLVLVVGGAIAYFVLTRAPSVEAPRGGEVAYTRGATEDDARRLRDVLAAMEYFGDGYYVEVRREGMRFVVSYAVTDEGLRDSETAEEFGDLSERISKEAFAGAPVDTELVDDEGTPHRLVAFERRLRTLDLEGDDELRFRDISEDQARAIARVLADRFFFTGESSVAEVESDGVRVEIELWYPEDTKPTAIDDLIWQALVYDLSNALGGLAVDLELGDLEDQTYARYLWSELSAAPVRAGDATPVFYRDGGTQEEAAGVAELIDELDDGANVLQAIVLRDGNYEPPRAVVAVRSVYMEGDKEIAELHKALYRFSEPLSGRVFGGQPVDIRMIDDDLQLEAVLSWEKRPKARRAGAIRPTR